MGSLGRTIPSRPHEVPAHTLSDLARHLGAPEPPEPHRDRRVCGVTLDSRAVAPGDVYAAVPGAHVHGAEFAADAQAGGAVAVLTDRAGEATAQAAGLPVYTVEHPREILGRVASWIYGEPSRGLRIAGVTGTNGKTTTAYLIDAGLRAAGLTTGLIGTIEIRLGAHQVPSVRTTPEAPDLQALLAVMRENSVEAVAMEVSSHALALGRVNGTSYEVGIFTNLSADHLDFHRDLEDYFDAKARLFTPELVQCGVVNVDDPHGARLARQARVPMVTVSPSGQDAHWRVSHRRAGSTGSMFRLEGPEGVAVEAATKLAGSFNIDNAALALVGLAALGIDLELSATGVASLAEVPGRVQRVDVGQNFVALVDFAHTPDALRQLLVSLRQVRRGRLILVFGCGGDRDPYKRPEMGRIAARDADVVVLTSDNPRSEDPLAILAAIHAGAREAGGPAQVEIVPDRRAAIELAVSLAHADDLVVVAGKGHEQGQDIGGVVHPFDDAEVLRAALAARGPQAM